MMDCPGFGWLGAIALGELAQEELQTSVDQLLPLEFVTSAGERNATLETAMG
jgi:hypothetical protein